MSTSNNKKYLPVMIDLTDLKIVIIGAGKAAAEKLHTFSQLKVPLTVIATQISEPFKQFDWITRIERPYQHGDLKGFNLAYIGINDSVLEKEIAQEAREEKILVNFIDKVDLSGFISPSAIIKKNFSLFISTYGKGPGMAKRIRKTIEENIDLDGLDLETQEYIIKRNQKNII